MGHMREKGEYITRTQSIDLSVLIEGSCTLQNEEQVIVRTGAWPDMIIGFGNILANSYRPGATSFLEVGWSEENDIQKLMVILFHQFCHQEHLFAVFL